MPPKRRNPYAAIDESARARIEKLARELWLTQSYSNTSAADLPPFQPDVVDRIYTDELLKPGFSHRRAMALEVTQYLEGYLWANFTPDASRAHVISICAMVNEKARERVPPWQAFVDAPTHFPDFFRRVLRITVEEDLRPSELDFIDYQKRLLEHMVLLIFLTHCFGALAEIELVQKQLNRIISLGIWSNLLPQRLELELSRNVEYRRRYRAMERRDKRLAEGGGGDEMVKLERCYLARFIDQFLARLEEVPGQDEGGQLQPVEPLLIHYLERCLLVITELETMLFTRRFFNPLVDDRHVVVRCRLSPLYRQRGGDGDGHLFVQLTDILDFYVAFPIDDASGEALTDAEMAARHSQNIMTLQRRAYQAYREEARQFALVNVAAIGTEVGMAKHLRPLDDRQLYSILTGLSMLPPLPDADQQPQPGFTREFLMKILVHKYGKRRSQLEYINSLPLYPAETLVWDESRVPTEFYSGEECLALPKLGLQYLSLHDYLLRNFDLFRLESTYEIRQDIEDAVSRMKPWRGETGEVVFGGWSRMALPIQNFNIIEVAKPNLGFSHPSRVRADLTVTLNVRHEVRNEWEGMRRYDPCFLITVRPNVPYGYKYNHHEHFVPQVGLIYVRGCEIEGLLDVEGKIIGEEDRASALAALPGETRTWRVRLDPAQYQADLDQRRRRVEGETAEDEQLGVEDVYDTFNIILRRKPKENNFKAVLETIRDLMNTRCVVPDWLKDLVLGFEDPSSAHYSRRTDVYDRSQDWRDTFLDPQHLVDSLPQYAVRFVDKRGPLVTSGDNCGESRPSPPYRLIFPEVDEDSSLGPQPHLTCPATSDEKTKTPELIAEAYQVPPSAPLQLMPRDRVLTDVLMRSHAGNQVRFTRAQVEAIRAGMQPGLTLVVGPPGTGKTDVAVQIVHNLYHNYPNQRTLIVTHSNQALNQLFEKIMALDIDDRHLLRLGHGQQDLETDKDFSKYGRVNFVLAKRIGLLNQVSRLARSLGRLSAAEDATSKGGLSVYTCETAQYFFIQDVLSRWEQFTDRLARLATARDQSGETSCQPHVIRDLFPFTEFFTGSRSPSDAGWQQLFPGRSLDEDVKIARACFSYLESIFTQLEEFRAFELMRTGVERSNFLLVQVRHLETKYQTAHLQRLDGIALSVFVCGEDVKLLDTFAYLGSIIQSNGGVDSEIDRLASGEAKIIAMTCTHAALRRRDLVELGFTYDNILMEEAAQILEIETFIPLLLQNPDLSGLNRLKRWVMIGDHHQLPPVVKNQAFQNYSNMGQSLFARLVKLGVPTVDLDAQGRARPSLAALYSWRYKRLTALPHVIARPEYKLANPGLAFDYQMIDVQDYRGVGESEPSPYFYQNLAEAEFLVFTFMYMRLLGYPADRITVLTTYNGQKHLLRDVFRVRCENNPLFGMPSKITTVDKFQGQQNDYILLSLVRTRTVGHLRDVRRLVVAMSRARLGLYIFGRVGLFAACHELRPTLSILTQRLTRLVLLPWEMWQDPREAFATEGKRMVTDDPFKLATPAQSNVPYVFRELPQLCDFVTEMYNRRVSQMTAAAHIQAAMAATAAVEQRQREMEEQQEQIVEARTVALQTESRGGGASTAEGQGETVVETRTDSEGLSKRPLNENSCTTEEQGDPVVVTRTDSDDLTKRPLNENSCTTEEQGDPVVVTRTDSDDLTKRPLNENSCTTEKQGDPVVVTRTDSDDLTKRPLNENSCTTEKQGDPVVVTRTDSDDLTKRPLNENSCTMEEQGDPIVEEQTDSEGLSKHPLNEKSCIAEEQGDPMMVTRTDSDDLTKRPLNENSCTTEDQGDPIVEEQTDSGDLRKRPLDAEKEDQEGTPAKRRELLD